MWVEPRRCGALGLCVRDVPELFRFQEGSKRAAARFETVAAYLLRRARAAAAACPYRAIRSDEAEEGR